jgi:hypothetical protein
MLRIKKQYLAAVFRSGSTEDIGDEVNRNLTVRI